MSHMCAVSLYLGRGSLLCFGLACHGLQYQMETSLPASHTTAHPRPTSPQRNLWVCGYMYVCVCVAHIMLHVRELNGCFLATVVCVLIGQQLAGSGAMGK